MPDLKTELLFDERDLARASQLYLWALPMSPSAKPRSPDGRARRGHGDIFRVDTIPAHQSAFSRATPRHLT